MKVSNIAYYVHAINYIRAQGRLLMKEGVGEFIILDNQRAQARVQAQDPPGRKTIRQPLNYGKALHRSLVRFTATKEGDSDYECKVVQVLDYRLTELFGELLELSKEESEEPLGSRLATAVSRKELYLNPFNQLYPKFKVVEIGPGLRIEEALRARASDLLVKAEFISFEEQLPACRLAEIIGLKHSPHDITSFLLRQNRVSSVSQSAVSVATADLAGRPKIEGFIFSIDPEEALDLDDAISFRKAELGYQLTVHIADPLAHIAGLDLPRLAAQGETIYLPTRRIDLLPQEVIEKASLVPGTDKPAISVQMQLNEQGKVVSKTLVYKTIIRPVCKLSYAKAQSILDKSQTVAGLSEGEAECLTEFAKVMRLRKKNRVEAGYFAFERSEQEFVVEGGKIVEIKPLAKLESNEIIEEAMNLACEEVAHFMLEADPANSLNIEQPPPREQEVQKLKEELSKMGCKAEFRAERVVESFLELGKELSPTLLQWFKRKYIMCHQPSTYICGKARTHFSLMTYYTRFTSPIRRLPDLLVHQQLYQILDKAGVAPVDPGILREVMEVAKRVKRLKKNLSNCYLALYLFSSQRKITTAGLVVMVNTRLLELYCPEFDLVYKVNLRKGLSGMLKFEHLSEKGDSLRLLLKFKAGVLEVWRYRELNLELYSLGQTVFEPSCRVLTSWGHVDLL